MEIRRWFLNKVKENFRETENESLILQISVIAFPKIQADRFFVAMQKRKTVCMGTKKPFFEKKLISRHPRGFRSV